MVNTKKDKTNHLGIRKRNRIPSRNCFLGPMLRFMFLKNFHSLTGVTQNGFNRKENDKFILHKKKIVLISEVTLGPHS